MKGKFKLGYTRKRVLMKTSEWWKISYEKVRKCLYLTHIMQTEHEEEFWGGSNKFTGLGRQHSD